MTPAACVGICAVRLYQWTLRPVIGANCRFWPSCSEYAIEAFRSHGALRGSVLATRRILRCNPWHEGGIDLVPGADHLSSDHPDQGDDEDQRVKEHRWANRRQADGRLADGQTGH